MAQLNNASYVTLTNKAAGNLVGHNAAAYASIKQLLGTKGACTVAQLKGYLVHNHGNPSFANYAYRKLGLVAVSNTVPTGSKAVSTTNAAGQALTCPLVAAKYAPTKPAK